MLPLLLILIALVIRNTTLRTPADTTGEIPSGHSASWVIQPDGGGDLPTIQAAIDRAANGDRIILEDGTYRGEGNRDLNFGGKDLIIRSRSDDPGTCIIDCQGNDDELHRAFTFESGESGASRVQGIGITGGREDQGAAVWVGAGSSPGFVNCLFYDNHAFDGGAFFVYDYASPRFENCVFLGNRALGSGGAVTVVGAMPRFFNCTLVGNGVETGEGGGISCLGSALIIRSTIIAFNGPGDAVFGESCTIDIVGSNLFGNSDGDWTGPVADKLGEGGNIHFDPLFSDRARGDLSLTGPSPCLPVNNSGQNRIGAAMDLITAVRPVTASQRPAVDLLLISQDYPDDINPRTGFSFLLNEPTPVALGIHDLSGREVRSLLPGKLMIDGRHELLWNGRDNSGRLLAAGVYFCRFQMGETIEITKVTILRRGESTTEVGYLTGDDLPVL
jgi:hypothetical protein